jgi:hypothetical protein
MALTKLVRSECEEMLSEISSGVASFSPSSPPPLAQSLLFVASHS